MYYLNNQWQYELTGLIPLESSSGHPPTMVMLGLGGLHSIFNPILDGVWQVSHTLQLQSIITLRWCIMHHTHLIIPYIWSHEYPLHHRPKKSFKIVIVFEIHNLWQSDQNSPCKIGLNKLQQIVETTLANKIILKPFNIDKLVYWFFLLKSKFKSEFGNKAELMVQS